MTAPIPGWQRHPVLGEGSFLREWDSRVRATSRSVRVYGVAFDHDDVANELRMAITLAFRRCRWSPPGHPPGDSMVWFAINWKIANLWRTARRRGMPSVDYEAPDRPDEGPLPNVILLERDRHAAIGQLVFQLRRGLHPRDMALLQLRHVEELPRSVIAEAAQSDVERVRKQLETAKARAAAFLRDLGIDAWEDVEDGY